MRFVVDRVLQTAREVFHRFRHETLQVQVVHARLVRARFRPRSSVAEVQRRPYEEIHRLLHLPSWLAQHPEAFRDAIPWPGSG